MFRFQWKPGLPHICRQWLGHVAESLRKPPVWQPMLKSVLSTTIMIIIAVIPAVTKIYGPASILGVMVSVFGQPGQRFGKVVESVLLIALGTFIGAGWSNLGLYLSSRAYESNTNASFGIRAVFFVLAVIIHGTLRSSAPRLFNLVFFFMLLNISGLTGTAKFVTVSGFKSPIYFILTGIGVVLLVNIIIFPQFSGSFLGTSTIETLSETVDSFQAAGDWFISKAGNGGEEKSLPTTMRTRLAALSNKKPKLRALLGRCKTVQAECNFELVLAVLPPRSLKPISVTMMSRLIHVTISLINACESKFALLASDEKLYMSDEESEPDLSSDERVAQHQRNIALVKPIREIESGDIDNLEHIMSQIGHTSKEMQDQIQDAVHLITSALAYCYDVPELPSGSPKPDGILLQEMDIRMEIFANALAKFDTDSAVALENATFTADGRDSTGDITPRMETHLVSSFLIGISQAARQVLDMLKHSKTLIERRQARNDHRRIYWPHISWRKWLTSGGEQDGNVLPENARKEARTGYGSIEDSRDGDHESASDNTDTTLRPKRDEETGAASYGEKGPREQDPQEVQRNTLLWIRGLAADLIELFQDSDHLAFALRMTVAAFLVTWPAFVPSLNDWYQSVRGTWATLQLIIVFEVSIGTTFLGFFFRALGTTFGCSIGIIAWEIGQGNRVVLVVVLAIGLIPASYVHLSTQYAKAGTICMISLSVVGLAIIAGVNDDAPWEIYVQRLVSFLVGGTVALVVEMAFYPVRARDRLVESLVSSMSQISIMESSMAVGVESPRAINTRSQTLNANFKSAKDKAEYALGAAQTFLPVCLTEPRIKGNFKGHALVYGEMIYVLFQIIDRMDNMQHIRKLFGSSVLEELHEEIMPYRRNVASCVTLTLFMVQEALTTRMPLPQFLPSSRVAQLRSVARIRELLLINGQGTQSKDHNQAQITMRSQRGPSIAGDNTTRDLMTQQALLAWKASSAGMMEIIEYLEELVDLAKLLVGVNAFHSGLLAHRTFSEYSAQMRTPKSVAGDEDLKAADGGGTQNTEQGGMRRRLASIGRRRSSVAQQPLFSTGIHRHQSAGANPTGLDDSTLEHDNLTEERDISWSLQRVISKRMEDNKSKRRGSTDPKGKYTLRNVQSWTG